MFHEKEPVLCAVSGDYQDGAGRAAGIEGVIKRGSAGIMLH